MKINWLDETPLTYDEAVELLDHSHEKRLEMEDKNKWDAYVNNISFWNFLHDTFCYMYEEIEKEYNLKQFYYFPMKLRDFFTLEEILNSVDSAKLAEKFFKGQGINNIWEIVEDWWKLTFIDYLN